MRGKMGRLAGAAVGAAAACAGGRACAGAIVVGGGGSPVDPSRFHVTTFAAGVAFPTSMQPLADGSLLVGSSVATGGNYFSSVGQLLRFTDADGNGVADGPPTVLATGLPAAVSSVRLAGSLAFVASAGTPTITVLRQGATAADPFTAVGAVHLAFPAGWEHVTSALAVRPTPGGLPGDVDVAFNVGSANNAEAAPAGTTATASGLVSGSLNEASIYLMTVRDSGSAVSVVPGSLRQVAAGLRNAAGIAFAPNGDLLMEDNGIDGTVPHNGSVAPLSADELDRVPAAALAATLAGGPVPSFGFPDTYVRYSDGQTVGTTGIAPAVAFLPTGGTQTVGANEVALAPAAFGLGGGVLVGFHGEFDNTGATNDENGVAYADPDTGADVPFVLAGQATLGHPDGLLATTDSVYVSDLADSSLFSPAATGALYRITVVPEPASAALVVVGLTMAAGRRRRRPPSA